jgi:mono/diheme cytochrome c family protein
MRLFLVGCLTLWLLPLLLRGEDTEPLAGGLLARASDGERTVEFTSPTVHFHLNPAQSIHPQLEPDFRVEWNGFLKILRAGNYRLSGEAGIFIDGREVGGETVALAPGERPLRIAYERSPGAIARLQLHWESEFFAREPVPHHVLSHQPPASPLRSAILSRGRELVEELNCVGCHGTASGIYRGRSGPDLSFIGDRVSAAWIYKWLEDPRNFRKHSPMPVLLEEPRDRADVTAYLRGLGGEVEPARTPEPESLQVKSGEELFRELGCAACHGPAEASMDGLGSKMSSAMLARYLKTPLPADSGGHNPEMGLTHEEAARMADYLSGLRNPEFEQAPPAGDPVRGRHLVRTSGCLNCHELTDEKRRMTSLLAARPLEELAPGGGCLSQAPEASLPRYDLSDSDRAGLIAYLKEPDRSEAPLQDLPRMIGRLQCAACHDWHGPSKMAFNPPPPPLTIAGEKLRSGWLEKVLLEKKRIRPWMDLRMPHYPEEEMALLVRWFASASGVEPDFDPPHPSADHDKVREGIQLVGPGGPLSCVACHDFHGAPATGEMRGPDLVEMHERIRDDWFERWMHDPGRIIPGTAMPAFFSGMPEEDAAAMIERVWAGLSAGRNMPLLTKPVPMVDDYLLRVKDEPVLFRTFLEGSSSRSIAVGLPGGQNFAFDALYSRLRFAWTGEFLDVRPVWSGRGGGNARVLGERYYTAPDYFPLRFGDPEAEPLVRFRGYELIEQVPRFLYEADGVLVQEKVTAIPGGGLVRSFQLGPVQKDVWFVGETNGEALVRSPQGEFQEGRLRIPGGEAVHFDIIIQSSIANNPKEKD